MFAAIVKRFLILFVIALMFQALLLWEEIRQGNLRLLIRKIPLTAGISLIAAAVLRRKSNDNDTE